jgi:hypothetical protein
MHYNSRFLSIFAIFLLALTFAGPVHAQSSSFQNSNVRVLHDPPSMGRDYWFSLLTNYGSNLGGKYFALYVSSLDSTTVHVECGGIKRAISVQPLKSTVFNIPLAWEMTTSGVVEDKAIHVWSDDADIACAVMSHNAYTSDGMSIIPPIGWGDDYVVAGYAALFEGTGNYVYDLPSEFLIVANQDNTSVTITPSADLRVENSNGANCSAMFALKGVPVRFTMNRGQVIQLKTTCTQDCDNFDVTGTRVSSSNPVGVIAGSMCPNIPCDFPYCDHVCEMIPPMRTWAKTYYTLPFFQPTGMSATHSASTFAVIPSMALQKIYRMDSSGVPMLYCMIDSGMSPYWRNDISTASKWFSADPFLLVQYVNSASYPDNVNGQGDPAEVVVSGEEQFFRTSVFQTPPSMGNQTPYTNYVNVIADAKDKNVRLDGAKLNSPMQIDGRYVGYRVSNVKTGGHVVTSDSGAGVYVYGYGYDESYAYSGPMGTATMNSPDTLPIGPQISINGTQALITLSDPVKDGGIYYIRPDSLQNVTLTHDASYIEGKRSASMTYSLSAIDPSKPGSAVVSAFNMSGNRTIVTTVFDPSGVSAYILPLVQNVSAYQGTTVYLYDTIVNSSQAPLSLANLSLQYGTHGFRIDSVSAKTVEGSSRAIVRIAYTPTNMPVSSETLLLGNISTVLNGTMLTNAAVNDATSNATATLTVDGRELKTSLTDAVHVDLYTSNGATALSAEIPAKGQLDVTSLAAGVYFYRLTHSGKTETGRIVIP